MIKGRITLIIGAIFVLVGVVGGIIYVICGLPPEVSLSDSTKPIIILIGCGVICILFGKMWIEES